MQNIKALDNKDDLPYKLYDEIVRCLSNHAATNRHGYWTDGDEIYCKTAEAAEHLADFLEDLGVDVICTGSVTSSHYVRID